jgi:UDP-2,4-diacetamido-2,4,6-trideoxy-beta-L-altropyranose hydrolase
MMKPLVIRADANTSMGTGHVMRCLALAQAWQDAGGEVTFLMAESTPAIEGRLRNEGIRVARVSSEAGSLQDARELIACAKESRANWAVVDGYQFGEAYQRAVKESGTKLLLVDDNGHSDFYVADIVLNQNIHANEALYAKRDESTRLLLGPQYAMLRREFNKWRGWNREIPEVARKVLVTMGGSDPENVTARVMEALRESGLKDLEVKVVAGGSNPHMNALQEAVRGFPSKVEILHDVNNMPGLMAWADVSVASGGTTTWELCFLGMPSVLMVLAENQSRLVTSMAAAGVALEAENSIQVVGEIAALVKSRARRVQMSQRARVFVDGLGCNRVMSFIEIELRRAEAGDCRQVWEWANDPVARAASFSNHTIGWEQHQLWFEKQLSENGSVFYIALDNQRPIGQVRYGISEGRALVSISVDLAERGKGKGFQMLTLATHELFRTTGCIAVDAYVKRGNERSVRLFAQSGFEQAGVEWVRGQEAIHFVLKRARSAN